MAFASSTARISHHLRQSSNRLLGNAGLRLAASHRLAAVPSATRQQFRTMVIVSQHKSDENNIKDFQMNNNDNNEGDSVPSRNIAAASNDLPAPLIVTESTWKRIRQLNQRKGINEYLRVFVDAGGCSGFSYVFELSQDDIDPDEDVVVENPFGEERVIVDQSSLHLIKGSTIDFVEEMIKSSFEVRDNPQSESACGCGSSFAVKNFTANPAID
ncbi:hypothetical protein MPSEU_000857200 [Mayamaea pseudoterrestris]|nr:hypothetical protein MPSEU_000857200 [Mayamaea pseudoterrestris]